MKKIKIYSLLTSLCLCIIYLSSLFLSTNPPKEPSIGNSSKTTITDASSKIHLENVIYESLFTIPSPYIEVSNSTTLPSFVRVKHENKGLLSSGIQPSLQQDNIVQSRSQNISLHFEHSSHYYIFALRQIII